MIHFQTELFRIHLIRLFWISFYHSAIQNLAGEIHRLTAEAEALAAADRPGVRIRLMVIDGQIKRLKAVFDEASRQFNLLSADMGGEQYG